MTTEIVVVSLSLTFLSIKTITAEASVMKNDVVYVPRFWKVVLNPLHAKCWKMAKDTWESCGGYTTRFLKYVWPFFNVMPKKIEGSEGSETCFLFFF